MNYATNPVLTIHASMNSIESILESHPFWQGIDAEYLPLLAECVSLRRFEPGEVIFQEHHDADHLYLLCEGHVALETFVPGSGVLTVQRLHAGEALGWSWLFPPHQWQFSARSLDDAEVLVFDARALRAEAEVNPEFGRELMNRMASMLMHRLQGTREKIQELCHAGPVHRLTPVPSQPPTPELAMAAH